MATTVLAGASLLASGSIGFMVFLMFMLAATRLYIPLSVCLQNLSAVYSTLLVVERMKAIEEERSRAAVKRLSIMDMISYLIT